ncbi:MAG: hypothetical protein ACTSU5_14330 [Promethearchaeota archaeon]
MSWELMLNWAGIFDRLGIDPSDLSDKERSTVLKGIEKEYGIDRLVEMEGEDLDAIVVKRIRKLKRLPARKPRDEAPPRPEIIGKPMLFPLKLDLDPDRPVEEQIRDVLEDAFRDGKIFDQMADFFKQFGDKFGGKGKGKRKRKPDDFYT